MTGDTLITTRQAALLHDVTPSTIRTWARRGLLTHALRLDGYTYYRLRDVDHAEWQARTRDTTGRAKQRTHT